MLHHHDGVRLAGGQERHTRGRFAKHGLSPEQAQGSRCIAALEGERITRVRRSEAAHGASVERWLRLWLSPCSSAVFVQSTREGNGTGIRVSGRCVRWDGSWCFLARRGHCVPEWPVSL